MTVMLPNKCPINTGCSSYSLQTHTGSVPKLSELSRCLLPTLDTALQDSILTEMNSHEGLIWNALHKQCENDKNSLISLDIAITIINTRNKNTCFVLVNVILFLWATHLNLAEKCVPELLAVLFISQLQRVCFLQTLSKLYTQSEQRINIRTFSLHYNQQRCQVYTVSCNWDLDSCKCSFYNLKKMSTLQKSYFYTVFMPCWL